jgi:lysophospholipase L1-like esterase
MQVIPLSMDGTSPVAFHNVAEVETGREGATLLRVPRAWRERFPEATALRGTQAAGVEIRFCARTRTIALELTTEQQIASGSALALYHGKRHVNLVGLTTPHYFGTAVLLEREDEFEGILDEPWRILCPYGALTTVKALYLSDDAELAAPLGRPLRWLAHGDSITQGAHAVHPGFTYVNLVADALGWDAINMGFGGSAWGDAVVAEYLASREDWDVLSIAIGTNTFGGQKESAQDYRQRYARFLAILREAHPRKPILCISPLWRGQDGPPAVPNRFGDTPQAYRQAIHEVVAGRQRTDPHLVFLDGLQVLGDDVGLTVDRVHPGPHGMVTIAQRIAPVLRRIV